MKLNNNNNNNNCNIENIIFDTSCSNPDGCDPNNTCKFYEINTERKISSILHLCKFFKGKCVCDEAIQDQFDKIYKGMI